MPLSFIYRNFFITIVAASSILNLLYSFLQMQIGSYESFSGFRTIFIRLRIILFQCGFVAVILTTMSPRSLNVFRHLCTVGRKYRFRSQFCALTASGHCHRNIFYISIILRNSDSSFERISDIISCMSHTVQLELNQTNKRLPIDGKRFPGMFFRILCVIASIS